MMSWSLYYVVSRFGDVLGTHLSDRYGGFTVCVIAITIVYALILPALLLVPKHLITTADGQTPELAFGAPEPEAMRSNSQAIGLPVVWLSPCPIICTIDDEMALALSRVYLAVMSS